MDAEFWYQSNSDEWIKLGTNTFTTEQNDFSIQYDFSTKLIRVAGSSLDNIGDGTADVIKVIFSARAFAALG